MNLTPDMLTLYAVRGGPYVHDPRDSQRPKPRIESAGEAVVRYLEVDPGTPPAGALPMVWGKLGPAARPADELMHRFFLESMKLLARSTQWLAARAFYPDATGLLVACVLVRVEGRDPLMCWVGYNARAVYVAGAMALANLPEALAPEGMR